MVGWKFLGWCPDGRRFEIGGVNVWEHEWTPRDGKPARVTDPVYGAAFQFPVYEIIAGTTRVTFAAGEFSNCAWGFYVPTDEATK